MPKVRHPEWVVAAAVLVCLPMARGLLSGEISGVTAGERFLGALVACWILGSILSWVISTYTQQATRSELIRLMQGDGRKERPVPTDRDPVE